MVWHILGWPWLANAAVSGLIVLALGSLAARICRQPVRRARLVVLTLLGTLVVPWLGLLPLPFRLPLAPGWPAGILPSLETVVPAGPAPAPTVARPGTDPEAGPLASRIAGLPAIANRTATLPAATERLVGGWASSFRAVIVNIPWRQLVLLVYIIASAGLLAWWLLGQALLWRVTRSARPVPQAVREHFLAISGPAGARVRLLVSGQIALPFTYTWTRPVILLPSGLVGGGDEEALGYCLAHEWSHVERHDARDWNLAAFAGAILFYQPLFWWLRRQLRLCQDYLADDRAAAIGSPEDYAAYLVRIARGRGRISGIALPALGIHDRRSNLSRRVVMLVTDRGPLEHRCPTYWSLGAATVTALAILVASGLRARATPASDDPKPKSPGGRVAAATDGGRAPSEPAPAAWTSSRISNEETLHYSGRVKEKETGKPIAGATVVVRRLTRDPKNGGNLTIEETRHTTNAEGVYSFTIPPEQVADQRLYIELDVEHPDYATQAGFGYSLALIRQDEAKGQRPFFENVLLRPAKAVLGRIETPEGTRVEGVEVLAYSLSRKVQPGPREHGALTRVKTDKEGRFRVPITTPGLGVFWILPKDFAPEVHAIPEDKRGEFGTFLLKKGVTVKGRAFGAQGKPLAGLFVRIERDRDSSPDREVLEPLGVSDYLQRQAETDAEGRFTFDPLPVGVYLVHPVEDQEVTGKGWVHRPLPGVFAPRKMTIQEGATPDPLEIRAAPHVVIEGGWIDSKGKPRSGGELLISGHIDGQTWHTMVHPSAEGKFSVQVPHGMERAQITLLLGQFSSTRYRVGKDSKLKAGQYIMFGTLDHDVKDLEIVRYDNVTVIVQVTAKDGRPLKDIEVAGEYTEEIASARAGFGLKNGVSTEIHFQWQADGWLRATKLTPDREVKITAYADGFKPASRKLKLPEGKSEEVTFVLEPK